MNFKKITSDLNKYTSFKECLDWNEELADYLLNAWKRDKKILSIVPKSLYYVYMATYLPSEHNSLICPLVNWLTENENLKQD